MAKAKRLLNGWGGAAASDKREVVNALSWHSYEKSAPLALDIETAGEHAEIIKCIGYSWDGDTGFCESYNGETHDFFAELLSGPNPKIFHNGQFDVTVLERHGLQVKNWQHDTMLLYHTLEPLIAGKSKEKNSQTQKSLRFLASILLNEPWWKNYQFESEEEQLRLCAKDARLTWQCWHELTKLLEARE